MISTRYSLTALLLALAFGLSAQEGNWSRPCGTNGQTPWFQWYADEYRNNMPDNSADTTWLYVPVTVHIVGTDNGGGYFPMESAIRALCEMNEQYAPARMRFYFMPQDPFRYINNSEWYEHDWDGGQELITSNYTADRLNIFVVDDPAGNCGYSWIDAIVMAKSCSATGNSTWAHEAGHHFSLPHTFSGWEGYSHNFSLPAPKKVYGSNVELADSSNCKSSGDRFCDTKADYISDRWQCDGNAQSTTLLHDPNNVPFRADGTMFMSYSFDACASRFSAEQITAMRTNLKGEHKSYKPDFAPIAEIPDNAAVKLISPVDTAIVSFQNPSFTWEPVPNARYYTLEIGYTPKFLPRLFLKTYMDQTQATVEGNLVKNKVLYWRVRAYGDWDVCQPGTTVQTGVFRTTDVTSINELERNLTTSLSPNPATPDRPAQLQLETETPLNAQLMLTGTDGRVFYRSNLTLSAGEHRLNLPTEALAAGIYIMTLQNEQGTIVRRLSVID